MMKFFRSYIGTRSIVYRFEFLRMYSLKEDKSLELHPFKIFLN